MALALVKHLSMLPLGDSLVSFQQFDLIYEVVGQDYATMQMDLVFLIY